MVDRAPVGLRSLRQVGQPVLDFDRAVAFYRDVVGLPLIAAFPSLAFFDLDGVRLLLEVSRGDHPHSGSVLYFAVDDIHAAREELGARGVAFEQEPHLIHRDEAGTFGAAGEEEWMAFFRDTEDNLLAIASRQPGSSTTP